MNNTTFTNDTKGALSDILGYVPTNGADTLPYVIVYLVMNLYLVYLYT